MDLPVGSGDCNINAILIKVFSFLNGYVENWFGGGTPKKRRKTSEGEDAEKKPNKLPSIGTYKRFSQNSGLEGIDELPATPR